MTELEDGLSLEAFRLRAKHLGLTLSDADLTELHKGYVGLRKMMQRIPDEWAAEAEPAHVFLPIVEAAP
jgi:hypothetical protein